MPFSQDQIDELDILLHFKTDTMMAGIKVHKTAKAEAIAATQRLFDKGLVTQPDGGYLTDLGHDAAEHAHTLVTILTSK